MRGSILPVTIPPRAHPRENPARLARGLGISSSGVLPGGRGAGQIEITTRARTYGVTQWRLLELRGKGHVFRFSHFVNLQSES